MLLLRGGSIKVCWSGVAREAWNVSSIMQRPGFVAVFRKKILVWKFLSRIAQESVWSNRWLQIFFMKILKSWCKASHFSFQTSRLNSHPVTRVHSKVNQQSHALQPTFILISDTFSRIASLRASTLAFIAGPARIFTVKFRSQNAACSPEAFRRIQLRARKESDNGESDRPEFSLVLAAAECTSQARSFIAARVLSAICVSRSQRWVPHRHILRNDAVPVGGHWLRHSGIWETKMGADKLSTSPNRCQHSATRMQSITLPKYFCG